MNRKGLTLLEVFMIVVVIGVLVALFVPWIGGGGHPCVRTINCANNLRQLYKLGTVFAASHKGEWPSAKGADFWLYLTRTKPPLIEEEWMEIFACPIRDETLNPGETDYLGPLIPWSQLKPSDPIAADKPGNHGPNENINVLLKDGSVLEIGPDDPFWKKYANVLGP